MRNTTLTMTALPCEVQTHGAIFISRKGHPLINQPLNRCGTFFGDVTRSGFHNETGTGIQGIAHMGVNAIVFFVYHPDNATLRPSRSGLT